MIRIRRGILFNRFVAVAFAGKRDDHDNASAYRLRPMPNVAANLRRIADIEGSLAESLDPLPNTSGGNHDRFGVVRMPMNLVRNVLVELATKLRAAGAESRDLVEPAPV